VAVHGQCVALAEALLAVGIARIMFDQSLRMAEAARDRNDLRFLRRLRKELLWMAQDVPTVTEAFLRAIGIDCTPLSEQVDRIIAKGRIVTDGQYRLVGEHIDALLPDPAAGERVKQLEALLLAFTQQRTRGKA
jgi:hypothetical protein